MAPRPSFALSTPALVSVMFTRRTHRNRRVECERDLAAAAPAYVPVDRQTRVCALARTARTKLAEWVATPLPEGLVPGMRAHELEQKPELQKAMKDLFMGAWFKAYGKVGEHEGCGIILIIARIDPRGTGEVTESEIQQLWHDVEARAEHVLGYITTIMIVSTLSLAVTVPLMIWPLSTFDGSVDSETYKSVSLGGGWPGGTDLYAAWLDSRALAAVHWFETIFLSISIYNAVKGTLVGMVLYSNIAIYAPDSESKLYSMYDNYAMLAFIFYCGFWSMVFLLIGLILLTARVCPLACMCLFVTFLHIFYQLAGFCVSMTPMMRDAMLCPALNQLRMAQEILHADGGVAPLVAEATPVANFRSPT